MKISAIKAQVKNTDRVSIFLEGTYSFSLTLDQLLEQKLKKDDELDDSRVKQLKKLSDEGKLKQRALEWLMGRPHSMREFKDYLYKKNAEKDLIAAWTEDFTDKKYLDDEAFARWFAENRRRKNKSSRAIYSELISKGVLAETIQRVINELEQDTFEERKTEKEALAELVNKLRNRSRYQDTQKLMQYLVSKGFTYDDIKSVLSEVSGSHD
jgi:regulatory protein